MLVSQLVPHIKTNQKLWMSFLFDILAFRYICLSICLMFVTRVYFTNNDFGCYQYNTDNQQYQSREHFLLTKKSMNKIIVITSVSGKLRNNLSQIETSTSTNAIHTAIETTKRTDNRLQLFSVTSPNSTMSVHVVFENSFRSSTERIKVFTAAGILVDVDRYPVSSGMGRRVGVADEQACRINSIRFSSFK